MIIIKLQLNKNKYNMYIISLFNLIIYNIDIILYNANLFSHILDLIS
jgi:hypothetical protein